MTDPSISAAFMAWLDAAERDTPPSEAQALGAAEAWAALAGRGEPLDAAALARALNSDPGAAERDALLSDPAALLQIEAAEDFLASAEGAFAPAHLLEAAQRLLAGSAKVVAFPRRTQDILPMETFRLRAAASATQDKAILCRSESGIWVLEVFIDQGRGDRADDLASILLSVDPDYHASYEGRRAKVFVTIGETERVLAEADIRSGELYAEVSLAGLNLHARDAISVVFSPGAADEAP